MVETQVKDSILQSTKKLLGLEAEYTAFDLDVQTHINSAFSTLYQAGVGPVEGFSIEDETASWSLFVGNKMHILDVKTYIYFRVRMAFDPPTSSFGLESINKQLDELIWRLNVADDFSIEYPSDQTVVVSEGTVWDLTGGLDFPAEAKIGEYGFDFALGNVWRNV